MRLLADRLIAAAAAWPLAAPPLAAATTRRDADDPGRAHEPDPSRDPSRPDSAGGGNRDDDDRPTRMTLLAGLLASRRPADRRPGRLAGRPGPRRRCSRSARPSRTSRRPRGERRRLLRGAHQPRRPRGPRHRRGRAPPARQARALGQLPRHGGDPLHPRLVHPVHPPARTSGTPVLRPRLHDQRPRPPRPRRLHRREAAGRRSGSSCSARRSTWAGASPTDATYEDWLEEWLNARAAKIGLDRRFEVINFAMAAYGPTQRLERFRTFAAALRSGPGALLGHDARPEAGADPPLRHPPLPGRPDLRLRPTRPRRGRRRPTTTAAVDGRRPTSATRTP